MHTYVLYHTYFIMMSALLSYQSTPFVGSCYVVMYIMFLWFHSTIILAPTPIDFNTGSYCPTCRKVTGMGLKHCNICEKCIPEKWIHSHILNRCSDKLLIRRWLGLFKIIVIYSGIITIIRSMMKPWFLLLMPIHAYMLKSTYYKGTRYK